MDLYTYVVRDMSHEQQTVQSFETTDDARAFTFAKTEFGHTHDVLALICTTPDRVHFVAII